ACTREVELLTRPGAEGTGPKLGDFGWDVDHRHDAAALTNEATHFRNGRDPRPERILVIVAWRCGGEVERGLVRGNHCGRFTHSRRLHRCAAVDIAGRQRECAAGGCDRLRGDRTGLAGCHGHAGDAHGADLVGRPLTALDVEHPDVGATL